MKAYIYFNSQSKGLDYNGEGLYVLVTEDDKCIGSHLCSSRDFANHDLTEGRLKELQENNISEVYSNGEIVWKNQESIDGLIEIPNHDKFIEKFNNKFNCNYKVE